MDSMFYLLVLLVAITFVLRATAAASQNSAKEEMIRKVVKEHVQKRKLDELYGRDRE